MEQKLWLTLSKTREQGQFIEPTVYRVYSHRNNQGGWIYALYLATRLLRRHHAL